MADTVAGSNIKVGAQNMHWEAQGAFTGEVAPVMLTTLCRYVILGHSERRAYFGETNADVNRKVQAALAHMMVASIGPLASERLRQHGFPVDLEPCHPKMGLLVKEASQAVHAILATKNAPPI